MRKLTQWAVFIFSLFVLALCVRYYVTHPGAVFEFDKEGLNRLALSTAMAIACLLMGVGFVRKRRGSSATESHGIETASSIQKLLTDLPANAEHPFKTAFRRRPVLASLLVAFPISLPFLFVSLGENRLSSVAFWCSILIGELLVVAAFVIAWHRVKYLIRKQRNRQTVSP